MKRLAILAGWLLLVTAVMAGEAPVAIIGAMSEEVSLLDAKLTERQSTSYLGLNFIQGRLGKHPVVLVRCGIGKVNAAMTTALLVDRFHPEAVIFTGIAGGISLELGPGDLVIGNSVIHHDYGMVSDKGLTTGPTKNPITEQDNPLEFKSTPALVGLAQRAASGLEFARINPAVKVKAVTGVIVTGDAFIASPRKGEELRRQFNASAVEMEGAAVAQVCTQSGCPFVIIRSVSDRADSKADIDINKFCRAASDNSALLVEAMLAQWPDKL